MGVWDVSVKTRRTKAVTRKFGAGGHLEMLIVGPSPGVVNEIHDLLCAKSKRELGDMLAEGPVAGDCLACAMALAF